jgi:localization factor PodJL
VRQRRRSYREPDDDEDAISENLAAVNERLDDLTRQLERIAKLNAPARSAAAGEPRTRDHVADALARLDRRLDQIVNESRDAPPEPPRGGRSAPPRPAAYPPQTPVAHAGFPDWAAQIAARQRALDGEAPATAPAARPPGPPVAAPAPMPAPAFAPGPDLAGLERQLRDITSQIANLHQPYQDALSALRADLAEIGRALNQAAPQRAIEALESQVRALADRIDRSRQAGADAGALAGVEHGLAEVRDALRNLKPAESLVGFEDAVRGLAHKIDQIAASAQAPCDPAAFRQLEQAVVSLRGVMANVASEGALAQLAAEVHGLAARFEQAAADSSSQALSRLESRITALMESGRAVPPELEGSIRSLSERLDRLQLSKGDQLALESLEDRIAKLSEKLDASDARLRHLDAIERGIADLLVYLEEMRNSGRSATAAAPAVASAVAPSPLAANPPATPPPPIEPDAATPPLNDGYAAQPFEAVATPSPPPASVPALSPAPPPGPRMAPPPPERRPPPPRPRPQPIDPNLPPDTPLEPGSGVPKARPGSAAARIAASEAALGAARPSPAENGGKAAAIAAARHAARSASLDAPAAMPRAAAGKRRRWFRRAPKPPERPPLKALAGAPEADANAASSAGRRIVKHLKTLLVAASVAVILIGAVQTVVELLLPGPSPTQGDSEGSDGAPRATPPSAVPSRQMPAPEGPPPRPQADPGPTGQINRAPSFFDPSAVVSPKVPLFDITGSIPRQQPAPSTDAKPPRAEAPPAPAPAAVNTLALPDAFGAQLRQAALANDTAALYEVGIRHLEGRGVPANPAEAARWLERAANAGFAPAQFRLAGMNEKGEGVRKDLNAARRLYLAAANKGHAKAMHNLAVLYAEGMDGKPDYKSAAQWFRKAAGYGIADSQYNLAILYARGIGVETNLAESYKWFALAARNGDADASRKRDEVGSRLNQQTLTAAKLAAQTFVPEREPAEAIDLRTPPGGWDRAPAPQARATRRSPAPKSP